MNEHVSAFVLEEAAARGWSLDDLALRMGGDFGIQRAVLDFLILVGPVEPDLRLGNDTAQALGHAFGVDGQLFLNLEKLWLASRCDAPASSPRGEGGEG